MSFHLPTLAPRRGAFETCGYCPKLCRAECPVSNADRSETLTPWGKMSLAWFAARGLVPVDSDHAQSAWGCTGCDACTEQCDHSNPVAATLLDVRAAHFSAGAAPRSAERVARGFEARDAALRGHASALEAVEGVVDDGETAVVVGCQYVERQPELAAKAVRVVARLCGPVRVVAECCGAPLLSAGDRQGFEEARKRREARLRGVRRIVAVDPGCAVVETQQRGPAVETFVHLVDAHADRLTPLSLAGKFRWQDPCKLARGLGQLDEPRRILTRILGQAPDEFARAGANTVCAGAGDLLPVTMPDVSKAMTRARLAEHETEGGGTVVVGCASTLRSMTAAGHEACDIISLVHRSLFADE